MKYTLWSDLLWDDELFGIDIRDRWGEKYLLEAVVIMVYLSMVTVVMMKFYDVHYLFYTFTAYI